MNDHLVTIGGELKALGDGRIGGYLVRFGTPDTPDLTGDYFTAETDFDLDDGTGKSTVLYHHGLDAKLGRRKLGRADLRQDKVGVWMEAQLAMRDEYDRAIYDLVNAGKMGLSSGTAPHLVEREPMGKANHITRWPLGLDASITPIPAEPKTRVTTIKSYLDMAEPFLKALLPQDDAGSASAGAAEDSQPDNQPQKTNEVKSTMDNEQVQAAIAQAAKEAAEAATKAIMDKLAAEPVSNPMTVEVKSQPAQVKANAPEFKGFGDYLNAVRRSQTPGMSSDNRLDSLKAASGLNETDPAAGGYLVAPQYATEIFKRAYETGALASRARRMAISSNTLKINAIDETSRATGSRHGGVQAYWRAEADTVTASRPKFRQMTLTLNELMAIYYATDEVLADTTALGNLAGEAFAEEFGWLLDNAILRGTGAGQPAGILSGNATVSVAKEAGQVAGTVVWENIVKMRARLWARSRASSVWFIHQDVEPQLQTMAMPVGVGGVPVYLPATGAAGAPYDTLFGRPVVPIEQCSSVGTVGDIVLADLSQYILAEKGGLEAASSMHVRFLYAEQTFRFIMRVDGQPVWQSALTPANGTNTVSPFITLATRA